MRSLRKCSSVPFRILGCRLVFGRWYKVFVGGDSEFWLVRYYGINDKFHFLHKETAYNINSCDDTREYESTNGIYHGLCNVNEISDIEGVSLEYVKGFGIEC
jgi:hypothetical protein